MQSNESLALRCLGTAWAGMDRRPGCARGLSDKDGETGCRYGSRVIDLDILFYDDRIVSEEGLTIPHPRLHERGFVLVPLAEIAPELMHPLLKRTVRGILKNVDVRGIEMLKT